MKAEGRMNDWFEIRWEFLVVDRRNEIEKTQELLCFRWPFVSCVVTGHCMCRVVNNQNT